MPATDQQQLQHHVRKLLEEVSSSDHVSSSDNEDHKTNAATPTLHQAYQRTSQQHDNQSSLLPQQTVSPNSEKIIYNVVCVSRNAFA